VHESRLFFSRSELRTLIQHRQADPVGRQLFCDLMAAADWARKQPLPAEPDPGPASFWRSPPLRAGQTPYSEAYLLVHEAFERATFAFERSVQELSLAYLLTGERPWADRAIEWLDAAMNEWRHWWPKCNPTGQFRVRIMSSTALALDWLGDVIPPGLQERCRERLADSVRCCLEDDWGKALEQPAPWQAGNHFWFDVGMLGLTCLHLGGEDAAYRAIAERCGRTLDRLSDWSLGPEGDHIDKTGHMLYGFRWALPMLVAWQRAGGADVLAKPAFGATLRWVCDLLWPGQLVQVAFSETLFDRWILMLLAAKHRDPRAQWVALNTTDEIEVPTEPGWARWSRIAPTWAYLFYDESLAAPPPGDERGLPPRWSRSAGWAVLGAGLSTSRPKVVLYAGPRSPKNAHNQGELYVGAFGERLLETPQVPQHGYLSEHRGLAYYQTNLSGAVLVADGLGQASGQQWTEWPGLSAIGHEVSPPVGRLLSVESGPGWSEAVADLAAAYRDCRIEEGLWGTRVEPPAEWQQRRRDRLARFVRRVRLVGDEWLVLSDDVVPHPGQPVDLEWHFGTHGSVLFPEAGLATIEKGRAAMDLFLLESGGAPWSVRPYLWSEGGSFLSVSVPACSQPLRLLVVLRVRARRAARLSPVWKAPTLLLPGSGPELSCCHLAGAAGL